MDKLDPTKYRILRTADGDIYQRWWKGGHIGANYHGGGCGSSFNGEGADVPDQWRTLNPITKNNKINEIKNYEKIPIIFDCSYQLRLQNLIIREKLRKEFAEKANMIVNDKGIWNSIKVWWYGWNIRRLRGISPENYIKSFPKYPIKDDLG